MLDSDSSLTRRYGSLSRDIEGVQPVRLGVTVVLFLTPGDPADIRRSLASLEAQTLQPARVLLVFPPGTDEARGGSAPTEDFPLAARTYRAPYTALAAALFEDPSEAFAFLHSGNTALPHRLEHDECVLRLHPVAGVLTLPLLHSGPGHYPQIPHDLFPTESVRGDPPRVAGSQLLELPGGLAGSEWLLDCLTLQAADLRPWLEPNDLSILPGLQRCLSSCGEILVAERCITSCVTAGSERMQRCLTPQHFQISTGSANSRISVIVPCCNAERYLVDCLESIKAQTFDCYELICVDDGSTDATAQILQRYQDELQGKMKIITHAENFGLGVARNTGIAHAGCEYVASVDSDDWIDPDMLEALYSGANEYNAEVVSIGYKDISPRGFICRRHVYARSEHFISECDDIFALCIPSFCNKLWRRGLFAETQISFPTGIYFEDLATTPRLLARALKIAFVEGSPYNYRQRQESIVQSVSSKHMISYISAFDILKDDFAPRLASSALFRQQFYDMVQDNLAYFLRCAGGSAVSNPYAKVIAALGIGYLENLQRAYGRQDSECSYRLAGFLS